MKNTTILFAVLTVFTACEKDSQEDMNFIKNNAKYDYLMINDGGNIKNLMPGDVYYKKKSIEAIYCGHECDFYWDGKKYNSSQIKGRDF